MRSDGMCFEKVNNLKYLKQTEEVKCGVILDGGFFTN